MGDGLEAGIWTRTAERGAAHPLSRSRTDPIRRARCREAGPVPPVNGQVEELFAVGQIADRSFPSDMHVVRRERYREVVVRSVIVLVLISGAFLGASAFAIRRRSPS